MVLLPLSLSLIFLPALSYAEPLHFPLLRRAPVTSNMDYYNSVASHIRNKYGFTTPSKRATSVNINMTNLNVDATYYTSILIGTPSQAFNVTLDTGSADLWVADTNCTTCSSGMALFNPSTTSSFKGSSSRTTISYGSGQVSGEDATDTVSMSGFNVTNQGFLAVDTLTSGLVSDSVAGILGLGYQAIAATGVTPFWQAITNGGQLSSPEMSFYMTRFRGDTAAKTLEPGGTFTLGGVDTNLYTGSIEFLNLASTPSYWLLNLAAVTVQGSSVSLTSSSSLAAIDTGTTLIGGPSSDVQAIWTAVGGTAVQSSPGYYQFPCTTNVNITMSFGGLAWPINSTDMNLGPVSQGSSQCLGAIFDLTLGSNISPSSNSPSWVVGATFLKNVYSVFRSNPASVGFAQLSAAAGGSGAPGVAPTSTGSSSGSPNKARPAITLISLLATGLAVCLLYL